MAEFEVGNLFVCEDYLLETFDFGGKKTDSLLKLNFG